MRLQKKISGFLDFQIGKRLVLLIYMLGVMFVYFVLFPWSMHKETIHDLRILERYGAISPRLVRIEKKLGPYFTARRNF